MKQILIGTQLAYAAKAGGGTISGIKEINLLDIGAIAFFADDNTMLTTANAVTTLADKKSWYAAVGGDPKGAGSMISSHIPRLYSRVDKKAYVAPVNQVSFIGSDGTQGSVNFPGTLVAGTEAIIRLTKTTLGLRTIGSVYENEIKRYSEVVKTGDTVTTILNRLIVDINADVTNGNGGFVNATAVGSTTGINLTTIDSHDTFAISLDGIAINANVGENGMMDRVVGSASASVAITYGEGIPSEIGALELAFSTEKGNTNQIWLPQYYYTQASLVNPNLNYDKTTISFSGERRTALGNQNTYQFEIILAVPNSGTNPGATIKTLLDDIYQGVYGISPVESGS